MRAYSTRDFYAKTLAVLGLGALAGVGAVVDGWPGSVDVPRVSPAVLFSVEAQARPPLMVAATSRPVSAPAAQSPSRDVVHLPVALVSYKPALSTVSPELVTALEPPAPVTEPVPVLSVRETAPMQWSGVSQLALAEMPAQVPGRKASDSGIASAVKKTGSSIVSVGKKTGAVAGASIVGAVRVVGGAFRKALPI